jgi:hypothetical protein
MLKLAYDAEWPIPWADGTFAMPGGTISTGRWAGARLPETGATDPLSTLRAIRFTLEIGLGGTLRVTVMG